MNKGIILGCLQQNPGWQGALGALNPNWVNLKRSGGAHKIATFMRKEGWDIEVLDYWLAFEEEEFKQFIRSRVTKDTKFVGFFTIISFNFNTNFFDKPTFFPNI